MNAVRPMETKSNPKAALISSTAATYALSPPESVSSLKLEAPIEPFLPPFPSSSPLVMQAGAPLGGAVASRGTRNHRSPRPAIIP